MARLLYFAAVREAIGFDGEDIVLPANIDTARSLAHWLAERGGGYAAAFSNLAKLRCAIDQTIVPLDAPFHGAREIAFFPPVTGG